MHKNRSTNDNEDHGEADLPSEYEYEIPWKPNKLFYHNSIPNKTWHSIQNTHDQNRIVLISFFAHLEACGLIGPCIRRVILFSFANFK